MELALTVLVHQQFANNIQLLLLVPQEKKPWRLNPTNSSNVRKYMSRTVPCWSIFEQNCTLLARLQRIPWKFSSCVTLEYTVILPRTQRLRAIRQYLALSSVSYLALLPLIPMYITVLSFLGFRKAKMYERGYVGLSHLCLQALSKTMATYISLCR